jgi:aspartate/methionine/tyrosine aminotransferase
MRQAFVSLVLTLTDAGNRVVFFTPYYFNHVMAVQMSGGGDAMLLGPCDPSTLHPDLDWLAAALAAPPDQRPRMVVISNPCNPSGALMSAAELERASALCAAAGCWFVCDNTYERFLYEGRAHHCPSGPHVLHLFSFSKAYGLMGWRVGYIGYPTAGAGGTLGEQLLKVQDTNPICASQASQAVALAALRAGDGYVTERVAGLAANRAAALDALAPLGTLGQGVAGGEAGIYYFARLPPGCEDDGRVLAWLVGAHGVCIIPGTACGAPGHIRVAFANLPTERFALAAAALKKALTILAAEGMAAVARWEAASGGK